MNRLIVGCGYLGRRVADLWHRSGDAVYVVTRTGEHAAEFAEMGLLPLVADVLVPATLDDLPQVDTVLFAVGYDRSSSASIQQVYVEGLKNVLDKLPASIGCVIYISSTGVYAENAGDWVDEDSPTHPNRESTQASLDAERLLKSHRQGATGKILRLAGIYGRGGCRVALIFSGPPDSGARQRLFKSHSRGRCGSSSGCGGSDRAPGDLFGC